MSRMVFVAAAALAVAAGASSSARADNDGRSSTVRFNSFAGSLTAYQVKTLPKTNASVGDRIVAIASPAEGVVVDLKLFFSVNGTTGWTEVASAWGGFPDTSYTRQIDYHVPSTGFYKVQILNGWTAGNVLAGADRSFAGSVAAGTGVPDTCFGAIGPGCAFAPLPGDCIRLSNGALSCHTSVGSQKHDTCCSLIGPDGFMCNWLPVGIQCVDEWIIAQDDVLNGRFWMRVYDPTWVSYTGSNRVNVADGGVSWAEGMANAGSYLAPSGTMIRTNDANEGFCICATSFLDFAHPGNSICAGGCSPPPPPPGGGDECPPPPYYCP